MDKILKIERDNGRIYFRNIEGSSFILGDLGKTLEGELINKTKKTDEKGFLIYVPEQEDKDNITISRTEYKNLVDAWNERTMKLE